MRDPAADAARARRGARPKAKEARAKEFAKAARMEKEQVVRDLLKDAGCWTSTTGFVLAKDTAKFVKQHRAALRAVEGYASGLKGAEMLEFLEKALDELGDGAFARS